MTKVYAVTQGEYSDYHIVALYSTREKALEHIARYDAARKAGVEDWRLPHTEPEERELDVAIPPAPRVYWTADISLETGEIDSLDAPDYDDQSEPHRGNYVEITEPDANAVYPLPPMGYAYSCKSQKHAIKLAVEARQKWLREKGLPTHAD